MFGFEALLTPEMAIAMQKSGDMIVVSAKENTWVVFQNPTGELADSIVPLLVSPYELQIEVGVPYAARLEYGFTGADSLGRVYNEAPESYLQPAIVANEQGILELFDTAVIDAFGMIGGGL